MTTLDTSMYAGLLQPPKSVSDDLTALGQRDLQQQQLQQNQLALAAGQQKYNEDMTVAGERNNLRGYLSDPKNDLTTAAGVAGGYAAAPTLFGPIATSFQNRVTSQAAANKDNSQAADYTATAATKQYDLHRAMVTHGLQSILGSATPDQARQAVNDGVAQGYWSMQDAQQKLSAIPADPQAYQQWRLQQLTTLVSAKDQLDATKPVNGTRNTGGTLQNIATDPLTGAVTVNATTPLTASPDTVANNATSRANNSANVAKDLTVAGIDPNNPGGPSAGALSPAAIENAAARYNVDGTLPPMAMGPRGAVGRTAIMNRAAELAVGTDPTQLRVNQMDAKSAGSALTQLTKAKTMSAAFEDTANQNASLALSLSAKNDRTGIPLLNAGLQAWRTGTGSPEATQFAAANETFVNEYAKIMSGGMGNGPVSDAARNKAHSLLQTSMTGDDAGQYAGNMRLLQKEMANRMKGFDDQEAALKARISGKAAAAGSPAPADASPSTTASGATVSNW